MPETFAPRPYQQAAIDKLTEGWRGGQNRLAVVLPTGAGKTVVFANLIAAMLPVASGRPLVIAHREELLNQAADKIRAVNPHLRVGIVKAEKNQHLDVDVVVASVQTLAVERRRRDIADIGMAIVDECHHAAAPTYMEVLDHFGAWRGLPAAGFTATLTRQDGGLAEVWQDVVFRMDILDLIASGHLVDVKGKRVVVPGLDLDTVHTRNGDLADGELGTALEESGAAKIVSEAYLEHAADRPGVIFTPTVASAKNMAEVMTDAGIPTGTVWGAMPKDERAATLARYQAGDLQVLANCMVLTEGFDAPWTSCAVIARPTKSAGLYIQMAGRALRLAEGKKDALLLDVMGASTRHKLASIVDLTDRKIAAPKDGQTLTEAVDEEEAQGFQIGEVEWADVDLFHNSDVHWLQTYRGTWFIPAGDTSYFLAPGSQPGQFLIRSWTKQTGQIRLAPDPDEEQPQELAMLRAAMFAKRRAAHLSLKDTRWRTAQPTSRQLGLCRYRRIKVTPGWTAGEVADALDIHTASAAIDQWVEAAAAA
ncbi:DEAD/DEAH box helicase [Streptacidiphilus albus]|uniref:DEAD/DEAH box helicase n=1 Tax=Streptacidiphilus albus TaxID=105425 RepID=UPI00054B18AE|nr:DEAD/DEAH box helicase [Streptacidiphilus albus]